jgi:hypothetical protein
LRFVAAVIGRRNVGTAREALARELGDEAMWEAAATVSAFCGLVRVADGTGIQLDDGTLAASADIRSRNGIDEFAGAGNSGPAPDITVDPRDVTALFR